MRILVLGLIGATSASNSVTRPVPISASLRHDDPTLQQNGPQLIDQRCALSDKAITCAMQYLHVELFFALQFNEAHCRAAGGSDVAFGGIIRFQRDF